MAPPPQMERFSRREYCYQIEGMLVGVSCHLRKMFESRYMKQTGQPWSNSAKEGQKFLREIGQEVLEKLTRVQRDIFREGNLDNWDLTLLARVLRTVWKSKQYRHENESILKLADLRNEVEHNPFVTDFIEKTTIIRKALTSLGVPHSDIQKLIDQTCTNFAAEATKKFHEMKKTAKKFVAKGEIKKAIDVYSKVLMLGLDPGQISITHERRAECYLELMRQDKKNANDIAYQLIEDVNLALKYNYWSWNAHVIAARCYRFQGKYTLAINSYQSAVAISPQRHLMKEMSECDVKWSMIADTDFSDPSQMPMSLKEQMEILGHGPGSKNPKSEKQYIADELRKSKEIPGKEERLRSMMHYHGWGNPTFQSNYSKAFQSNLKSAKAGYPEGYLLVGASYRSGLGVPEDLDKSLEYTLKAANMSPDSPGDATSAHKNRGVANAQNLLGIIYNNGEYPVLMDRDLAVDWFKKALQNGLPAAAWNLGRIYFRGPYPIEKDEKKAVGYWILGIKLESQTCAKELVRYYQKMLEPEMAASVFESLQHWRLYLRCDREETDFHRKNKKVISERARYDYDVAAFEHNEELSTKGLTFRERLDRAIAHHEALRQMEFKNNKVSKDLSCVAGQSVPKDPTPCNSVEKSEVALSVTAKHKLEAKESGENLRKLLDCGKPFSPEQIKEIVNSFYTCQTLRDHWINYIEPPHAALLLEIFDDLFHTKCESRGDEDMKVRYCYVANNLRRSMWRSSITLGIVLLDLGIKMYPNNPHFHELLCDWYEDSNQYPKALESAESGLKRFPNNVYLRYCRAFFIDSIYWTQPVSKTLEAYDNFLEVAPQDYSSRPKVYYRMAALCIHKLPPERKNRETKIKKYFDMGEEAEKDQLQYPDKLYPVSFDKECVATHLKLVAKPVSPKMDQDDPSSDAVENVKQTGYLTTPARIEMVKYFRKRLAKKSSCCCENCDFQKTIGVLAAVLRPQETFPFSLNSGKRIRIQEMVSTVNKVYENRWIDLTIIEKPDVTPLAMSLLVEDDYGDVARLAVYTEGFNDETVKLFGFGNTLVVLNPFMGAMINSLDAIQKEDVGCIMFMETKNDMCRFCGEERSKFSCVKCHMAKYCSKACQEHDWKLTKHNLICGLLMSSSSD